MATSTRDRILSFVEIVGECWMWQGSTKPGGYGTIDIAGKTSNAHRVAYEAFVGPIPAGLSIDHLCRTPACVNPEHLEPVSQRENVLRGVGPAAVNAAKTHCPQGHEYSPANTIIRPGRARRCKKCHYAQTAACNRARRLRRRAAA